MSAVIIDFAGRDSLAGPDLAGGVCRMFSFQMHHCLKIVMLLP